MLSRINQMEDGLILLVPKPYFECWVSLFSQNSRIKIERFYSAMFIIVLCIKCE